MGEAGTAAILEAIMLGFGTWILGGGLLGHLVIGGRVIGGRVIGEAI